MSIRPVDMQVVVPKSLEIARSDSNLSHRPNMQQQGFAQVFQKKTEQAKKQVIQTSETEKNSIERHKKNNKDESKQKNKNKNSNPGNESKKNKSTSMYDIIV